MMTETETTAAKSLITTDSHASIRLNVCFYLSAIPKKCFFFNNVFLIAFAIKNSISYYKQQS
jgi:hypothetical protein